MPRTRGRRARAYRSGAALVKFEGWCLSSRVRLARLRPRPSGAPARRVDPWQIGGLVACIVLVFSQSFAALHFALIPHRFCPVHGLEDTPVLGARPHVEVAPPARAHRDSATRDRSSEGAHERCTLLMTRHDRFAVLDASGTQRLAAPASTRAPSATRNREIEHPLALWLVAPKQGPPA
jgi:hypothetical protein